MIGVIFQFGSEIIEVRVNGISILFKTSSYGNQYVPIDNLLLSKEGVIKEHPDLEDDPLWRQKALERFKAEIKKLGNENRIIEYIIKDLAKFGYVAKYKQKQGCRVEVLNA